MCPGPWHTTPNLLKSLRVYLGTPTYGGSLHYGHVLQALGLSRPDSGVSLVGVHYLESCSVAWARNMLLAGALRQQADWLLMVDSDTVHTTPHDVASMLRVDADVVGAPVKIRGKSNVWNAYRAHQDGWQPIGEAEWRGRVCGVDAIGTAFLAIRLSWIREHWPTQPWFEELHLGGDAPNRVSSDLVFCNRVKERGGLIAVDGRFEPLHLAQTPLSAIHQGD